MPPAYVRGLTTALGDAGIRVIHADTAATSDVDVHVVMMDSALPSWQLVPDGVARVCALVAEPLEDLGLLALRAGAMSICSWDAPTEHVVQLIELAAQGHGVVPTPIIHLMRAGMAPPAPAWLGPEERHWLRQLSEGSTIAEVAEEAGYSERSMYRVLYRLYARLGARNRSEAVAAASRWV